MLTPHSKLSIIIKKKNQQEYATNSQQHAQISLVSIFCSQFHCKNNKKNIDGLRPCICATAVYFIRIT